MATVNRAMVLPPVLCWAESNCDDIPVKSYNERIHMRAISEPNKKRLAGQYLRMWGHKKNVR
jgi:hypothetical protein